MDHREPQESKVPKVIYKKHENFDIMYKCIHIEGTKERYNCSRDIIVGNPGHRVSY